MSEAAAEFAGHGGQHERERKADGGVRGETDAAPGDAGGVMWRRRICRAEYVVGNRYRKIEPHAEQTEPCADLHPGELAHGPRHGAYGGEDIARAHQDSPPFVFHFAEG